MRLGPDRLSIPGSMDEVAIYATVPPAERVKAHILAR
jgi:hypothetical protein